MEELEKFSQAKLKEMSDQEVLERMAYLREIQAEIIIEIDACKDRLGLFKQPEKCERCGSTNLQRKERGGYFCRKCGFRYGIIDADEERRLRLEAGWPTNQPVKNGAGEKG